MTISKLSKEDVLEYAARLHRLKYVESKAMAEVILGIANDEEQWVKWDCLTSPRMLQRFFDYLLDPILDILSSLSPEEVNSAKAQKIFGMEKEFRAQRDNFMALSRFTFH